MTVGGPFVVVEGRNDRAAVRRALDVDVICTGGFGFGPDVEARLTRAARTRGLVVLTDPDHAGEQIRRRVEALVGPCGHARIPRDACLGKGRLGVEYAPPAAIRAALAHVRRAPRTSSPPTFTMADLVAYGLSGRPTARARRRQLGDRLSLGYANAKQLRHRLEAFGVTRAELEAALLAIDVDAPTE